MDRRGFLRSVTAAGIAGYATPACSAAGTANPSSGRLDQIGVQLYTIRDRMQQDPAPTLAAVAEIGYRQVETAGLYGLTPEQFRAALDRVGLISPAGHYPYPLEELRANLDDIFATALALGQEWVVVPSLAPGDRTRDGYLRVADDLNRCAAAGRERGLRIGYHNHDYEFAPLDSRQTGYDLLLTATDPALVDMELDLFWAVRAGSDPVTLFEQHPGRFRHCHVKDMRDIDGAQQMVDVGQGEIDFARTFASAQLAGLRYYFVEHDNPADPLASIETSYRYLRALSY
jgi:sugar phosphate isomerase/epimerase